MIIKRLIYYIAFAVLITSCSSNSNVYDLEAISYLDELSETIGNLESCSYTIKTFVSKDAETQITNINDVYMRGPDKMYVYANGTRGRKSYWYNGKQFAFFSYEKEIYDTLPAPDNIIKLIDAMHHKFNIVFPAADFFYPTLTDDIMHDYNEVVFFGDEIIDDVNCVVLQASNDDDDVVQIWIEKETKLPHKMVISHPKNSSKYYEGVFSNWKTNPKLPDLLFEFEPPENSTRVALKLKTK